MSTSATARPAAAVARRPRFSTKTAASTASRTSSLALRQLIVVGRTILAAEHSQQRASLAAVIAGNYVFQSCRRLPPIRYSISSPLKMAISGTASTIDTQGNLDAFSGNLSGRRVDQGRHRHDHALRHQQLHRADHCLAGTLELTANAQPPVLTGGGANIQAAKWSSTTRTRRRRSQLLAASYNGGLWNTGQFHCTTEDATHGLGWIDNGSNVTVRHLLRRRQPGRHRQRERPEHRAVELQPDRHDVEPGRLQLRRDGQRRRPQHGAVELQPARKRQGRRAGAVEPVVVGPGLAGLLA